MRGIFDSDDGGGGLRTASLAVDSRFAASVFNMTCLALNGTGDPCDLHVAEAWTDEIFGGLRIEYITTTFLSVIMYFSFAMLGGAPRPVAHEDESRGPSGSARCCGRRG